MDTFHSERLRTRGVDAAEARLAGLYGRVSIAVGTLDLEERTTGDDRFLISRTEYDGEFHIAADLDHYVVNLGSTGCAWQIGRDSGDLSDGPTLFQPGRPITAHIDRLDNRTAVLHPAALEQFARTIYADDSLRLRFDGTTPVDEHAAAVWTWAFALAERVEQQLASELVRASAYRLLAVSALECFRLTGDRAARDASASALLAGYRRAVTFVDEHASLPITTADIARAAGLSRADLIRAFRAHSPSGCSPDQYLRLTRIVAAHHDLLDADPTLGDTVAAIAQRWGFTYPGSFARDYRKEYGVLPSWTLRR
jgi:AraC-like DNA-binding protein